MGVSLLLAGGVGMSRPETGRASHGQGEGQVTLTEGPNPPMLKNGGMTCG